MAVPFLTVLSAIFTIGGTIASVAASNKAAKAEEEKNALARRRSTRMALREAQIRRAQAVATAQGAGALGSSGYYGGIGALASQFGEEAGYASQQSALSNVITTSMAAANNWGAVASFANQMTDWQKFAGVFNKPKTSASANNTSSSNPPMNFGSNLYGSSGYPTKI